MSGNQSLLHCNVLNCHLTPSLRCGGCGIARYCTKQHQDVDYGRHEVFCRQLQEALEIDNASILPPGDAKLDRAIFLMWSMQAEERGDPEAQYRIGVCHFFGTGGCKVDLNKAAEYFRLAAKKQHIAALFSCGWCYQKGLGVTKDLPTAVACFRSIYLMYLFFLPIYVIC
jgi:hypothetical protein